MERIPLLPIVLLAACATSQPKSYPFVSPCLEAESYGLFNDVSERISGAHRIQDPNQTCDETRASLEALLISMGMQRAEFDASGEGDYAGYKGNERNFVEQLGVQDVRRYVRGKEVVVNVGMAPLGPKGEEHSVVVDALIPRRKLEELARANPPKTCGSVQGFFPFPCKK